MQHRYYFEGNTWLWLVLAWLTVCLPVGTVGVRPAAESGTPSLAEVLNADGTLRAGVQGSFDAHNFRLHLLPNGRPAFRPLATAGAGDENWQDNFRLAGTNGQVNKILQVGSVTYFAGSFSLAGSVAANSIVKWDGTTWSSLGTGARNGVNGNINDMVAIGTDLYVGGTFTVAGGVAANRVARWDGTSWSSLGTGAANGINATVNALAAVGNVLYVGGQFSTAGGVVVKSLARWDGTAWSVVGTGAANGVASATVSGIVDALAVQGTRLYVGGSFSLAGGAAATNIASWDGISWSALGSGINSTVSALSATATDLYVVGQFTTAGGTPANNVARWNGTSWSALGTGPANGTNNATSAVLAAGGTVYVGGFFSTAGGIAANRVARWDGTSWSSLGSGLENGVGMRSGQFNGVFPGVQTLGLVGNTLYVGGTFTLAGSQSVRYLARFDGGAWSVVGSRANGADDEVYAVAVAGSDVYVGGNFTSVGNVPANRVARWNGSAWSALGMRTPTGDYFDGVLGGPVRALLVSGSNLYVGGGFQQAGNVAASAIARWDGAAWSSLGTGTTNDMGAPSPTTPIVLALAQTGTTLYAGGYFTTAGGVAASNVARWSGTAWSPVGAGTNSTVFALAGAGNILYAGGDFTTAGGLPANRIASWDGTGWAALGSGVGTPTATGSTGAVYALLPVGSSLYVGGLFLTAGGITVNHVARWDGATWSALGTGTSPASGAMTGYVRAFTQVGANFYVGGNFTGAGGLLINYVARWDGTTWSALGTGLNNTVQCLAAGPNSQLCAGGSFNTVGDGSRAASFFSVYNTVAVLAAAAPRAFDELLTLYPNPAHDSFRVEIAAIGKAITVEAELLDELGRVVRRWNAPLAAGGTEFSVSTVNLVPGSYVLRVQVGTTIRLCRHVLLR